MEGEDMLSIKVSSHLVQVYDTGTLVSDLVRLDWVGTLSSSRERVTHPCLAESKMNGRRTKEAEASVLLQVRPEGPGN